jgi:uncharacterized membrane protein YsdA (DUF1294 family)
MMSVFAFGKYAKDKKYAIKGKRRISEKELLGFSFFGGAIGGYLAMYCKRHKTKKWYFHFVHILACMWQISLWLYLFWQYVNI